jgi:hypothetical protein
MVLPVHLRPEEQPTSLEEPDWPRDINRLKELGELLLSLPLRGKLADFSYRPIELFRREMRSHMSIGMNLMETKHP